VIENTRKMLQTVKKRGDDRNMPINVFRNRNFRSLWFVTIVSASGYAVGNVVIEWIIYATTHTALLLTLLGVAEFVPMLTIGVLRAPW